jgi:hypothetical protein
MVDWKPKEGLVLTEQHVLHMIRFNATVFHPHWCVLVIMETLGFGVGRREATRGGGHSRRNGKNNSANDNVGKVSIKPSRDLNLE